MSELKTISNYPNAKRHLLASVSALTLMAAFPNAVAAREDGDHPTVWIEFGAQLERLTVGQESFAPPFVSTLLSNPFTPPSAVQAPPRYSFGQEGRLSFNPEGSNWVFSAAVRYGRANSSGSSHEETTPESLRFIQSLPYYNIHRTILLPAPAQRFATTTSQNHSAYLVADFQAGKDVGLGTFGGNGGSTINAGIRVAQFTSQSKARIDSDPDLAHSYRTITGLGPYHSGYLKLPNPHWDLYAGQFTAKRSFRGLGPSLQWDAAATLIGKPEEGAVTFDWGVNGALLFGRQKVTGSHETTAHHGSLQVSHGPLPTLYPTKNRSIARSRSVVVPNVGGFAGLSLRFPNAKVSLGYRIDAFLGAMDGGIDTRKTYDRDFYGPFATISIGLGG